MAGACQWQRAPTKKAAAIDSVDSVLAVNRVSDASIGGVVATFLDISLPTPTLAADLAGRPRLQGRQASEAGLASSYRKTGHHLEDTSNIEGNSQAVRLPPVRSG